jgi:hypothetical protein
LKIIEFRKSGVRIDAHQTILALIRNPFACNNDGSGNKCTLHDWQIKVL